MIPSEPLSNFAFKNLGSLKFNDVSKEFGLGAKTFSNGSAYGDLDNDGDLDLVINNVNMISSIYENKSSNNWISFSFDLNTKNRYGIGNKIFLYHNGSLQYQELSPMRGFQSSVDYRLYFGLGEESIIDSVKIISSNNTVSVLRDIKINTHHIIRSKDLDRNIFIDFSTSKRKILSNSNININYTHKENDFVDFDRERLLFKMNSTEGPCLCVSDFNSDGLEDLFVGSARGEVSSIFYQKSNGYFEAYSEPFKSDIDSEDVSCVVNDFNGDGKMDLIVASGGSEYSNFSPELRDRVYFNQGENKFEKSKYSLNSISSFESTSTISSDDIDNDGDYDLFVGTGINPGSYGTQTKSYLLLNDGKGEFLDVSDEYLGELRFMEMVNDSEFIDLDNDGSKELVVIGEWMPIRVFKFDNDKFFEISDSLGLSKTNGLYNVIHSKDLDGDGFVELIIGNYGLNSMFRANLEKPLTLYVNDFDNNGRYEQILGMYYGNDLYPIVQLKDLWMQLPYLKKKYLKFESYKNIKMDSFLDNSLKDSTKIKEVYNLESIILKNNKGINFDIISLPFMSQISPVYSILSDDFNNDGFIDLIVGGNLSQIKPEFGPIKASYSSLFAGNGDFLFNYVSPDESGLSFKGDLRDSKKININKEGHYIFAINNSKLKILKSE